jgi:Bacterial TniB protein
MPSDPSIARFYAMLMASMGAPVRPVGRRIPDYEHRVLMLLRIVGARILIIDELHNILAGSTKVQREFLNLLRFLGNELRIAIVGVGTKEAYLAIRSDDQLENRLASGGVCSSEKLPDGATLAHPPYPLQCRGAFVLARSDRGRLRFDHQ